MTNGNQILITVDRVDIPYVKEYIYKIPGTNDSLRRQHGKRNIAKKAFWYLKFILFDKNLSKSLKIEALQICIYPVLTYGSQTWALTAKQLKKFQVCQRKMLRKIIGISIKDRVPNNELIKMTASTDIAQAVAK